jgi:hypothetical protein
MALYAIGDLHLSFQANKPMDVFGGNWHGYVDKLREGLSVIQPEDTTVLLGDLTWSMTLDTAVEDFRFIDQIPGRKIILKGNHDYWWSTANKFYKFCQEQEFSNMLVLNNNCWDYGDIALCGTRGWFYEEERHGAQDEKIFKRELLRLEASLKAAGDREKLCFLHYPPRFGAYRCQEIQDLLTQYGVRRCFYGHLHGASHKAAFQGFWDDVQYQLVAADYLDFKPLRVLD